MKHNDPKTPSENLNIRLGLIFSSKLNDYLQKNGREKTADVKRALEYWISIDGNPEDLQKELMATQREIEHLQELLAEKERTISILQDQIQWLKAVGGHVQVNGNKNSHITALAESEIKLTQK